MAEHWENKSETILVEDTMTSMLDIDIIKTVYRIFKKAVKG